MNDLSGRSREMAYENLIRRTPGRVSCHLGAVWGRLKARMNEVGSGNGGHIKEKRGE